MAESAQSTDLKLQLRGQAWAGVLQLTGTVFGFALALAVIVCGTYLLYHGKTIEGFGALLVGAATLVGAAIYKHKTDKQGE